MLKSKCIETTCTIELIREYSIAKSSFIFITFIDIKVSNLNTLLTSSLSYNKNKL